MPRPTDWASHGDSDMMAPGQSRSASHAARAGGVGRGGSRLRPGIRAPTATAAATVSRLSRPEPAMPLAVTVLTEFPGPPSSLSLGPARAACRLGACRSPGAGDVALRPEPLTHHQHQVTGPGLPAAERRRLGLQ